MSKGLSTKAKRIALITLMGLALVFGLTLILPFGAIPIAFLSCDIQPYSEIAQIDVGNDIDS